MRLNSQASQFVFNLPGDFLPTEILETYTPILEKNWIQYENIIDYINSTIKSVNFPGLNFDMPKQIMMRGKERQFKPSKNNQDIITTRDLTITFRSVDSDLNYWLLFDIINKHYLDTEYQFVHPFTITCVDIHRDAIYVIRFYEIILKAMSEQDFNYSMQKTAAQDFTVTFHFNFYDIQFLLNKRKVLDLSDVPSITQILPPPSRPPGYSGPGPGGPRPPERQF
jgi:hypothetical protein